MKFKIFKILILLFFLNSCLGASSPGVFGTGVTVARSRSWVLKLMTQ